MLKRTITGIILGIILIPLLIIGGWPFTILISLLAYVAVMELLEMHASKEPIFHKLKFIIPGWATVTIIMGYLDKTMIMPTIISGILVFLIAPIINRQISSIGSAMMIFSYIYGGCFLGLAVMIRDLNLWIIIFMLISVMFTDIGAYTFGSKFGKHKLCPTISPHKTVEGSVLGTITGAVMGMLFYYVITQVFHQVVLQTLTDLPMIWEILSVLGITLILSIVGQLGDLVASKLKRAYGIKDYGKIFPGHGGVMDRFDSTILAVVVLYFICYLIGVL